MSGFSVFCRFVLIYLCARCIDSNGCEASDAALLPRPSILTTQAILQNDMHHLADVLYLTLFPNIQYLLSGTRVYTNHM